jgi:hypothetical protein
MIREPLIFSQTPVDRMKKIMFVSAAVAVAAIAFSGLRLMQTKMQLGELSERVKAQRTTLASMRQAAKKPRKPVDVHQAKIDAVARVQGFLERSAAKTGCVIGEFQASLERGQYLSVFTLDTNKPNWEQVQVHVTLSGSLSSSLATLDSLRRSNIPMEPDSIEVIRETASKEGKAKVAVHLVFRVLIMSGGGA